LMKILLTGASGFVGPHLAEALRKLCGGDSEIIATGIVPGQRPRLGAVMALDVTDHVALDTVIKTKRPTHVIHLAGIAAPSAANADPEASWRVHLYGTLALARAILKSAPDCWLIHIGSGMVYGESAKTGLPLDETALLAPIDEYSATKAAADLALGALTKSGLKCVRLRPFNHTGAGQSEAFVVPAFAMQIARIEAGLAPPVIHVGNLDAQRDFLDVRDVATAYALVVKNLEPRQSALSGTVLNIASGVPRRIADILDSLVAMSRAPIAIEPDSARQRPSDLPIIVGNASRARGLLQWHPTHVFEDTLAAVLDDCRARAVQ
jgi:GDP-4-dehydro-6-deoxy-D-mannose reductase